MLLQFCADSPFLWKKGKATGYRAERCHKNETRPEFYSQGKLFLPLHHCPFFYGRQASSKQLQREDKMRKPRRKSKPPGLPLYLSSQLEKNRRHPYKCVFHTLCIFPSIGTEWVIPAVPLQKRILNELGIERIAIFVGVCCAEQQPKKKPVFHHRRHH